jgi:hypothetical protein
MGRDHGEAHRELGTREWRGRDASRHGRHLFGVPLLMCAACEQERGGNMEHGLVHELRSQARSYRRLQQTWTRFGFISGHGLANARYDAQAWPDPLLAREQALRETDGRIAELAALEVRGGGYAEYARAARRFVVWARMSALWTLAEQARLLDALRLLRRTGRSEAPRPKMEAA